MKSKKHPAFIKDYHPSHTEILKTMPDGTYGIIKGQTASSFMLVVAHEGRVIGYPYTENKLVSKHSSLFPSAGNDKDQDIQLVFGKVHSRDSLSWSFCDKSIDQLIEEFTTTPNSNGIQFTQAFQLLLDMDTNLQKALAMVKERMAFADNARENKMRNLPLSVKDIISALKRDDALSNIRAESHDLIAYATQFLMDNSNHPQFDLTKFLSALQEQIYLCEYSDGVSKESANQKFLSSISTNNEAAGTFTLPENCFTNLKSVVEARQLFEQVEVEPRERRQDSCSIS